MVAVLFCSFFLYLVPNTFLPTVLQLVVPLEMQWFDLLTMEMSSVVKVHLGLTGNVRSMVTFFVCRTIKMVTKTCIATCESESF